MADHQGRYMVFSQAFRQMDGRDAATLRTGPNEEGDSSSVSRIWNTCFMGERGNDAGGLYRESWSEFAAELESPFLPLLVPPPNGRHNTGYGRDRWVLNAGSGSVTHRRMFGFLGKLMGMAIRTGEYMALHLAPVVWELLVGFGAHVTVSDLAMIDEFLPKTLSLLRNIEESGVTEETFEYIITETFTTTTIDDRTVELVPGGAAIDVTFRNRLEYAEALERFKLHEFDAQVRAMPE